MGFYFDDHQSMRARAGMQVERTLDGVVRRYLGLNPPHPLSYRAYRTDGIVRGADYRYHADFNRLLPGSLTGSYVYSWAKLWSDAESSILFDISCHGPTVVYANRAQVFASTIFEERHPEKRERVCIPLVAGWNHVVVRVRKTRGGFGGLWGTWLGKLPYYFVFPIAVRDGQEGWLFSEALATPLAGIPGAGDTISSTGVAWHPTFEWPANVAGLGQFERVFGRRQSGVGVAWTRAAFRGFGSNPAHALRGHHRGRVRILVDEVEIFAADEPGPFEGTVQVPFGVRDVCVVCSAGRQGWGFELAIEDANGPVPFVSPCNLQGSPEVWVFAGPFVEGRIPPLADLRNLHSAFRSEEGETFWRIDEPVSWVRPYNDNALFGKWNYPLGVTLYGILHSARAVGSAEAESYVVDHVQRCCDTYEYAMWDRRQFGGATNVHHLLTSLDSLDDCGSFGSAMLDVARYHELPGYRAIADLVADYIANKQIRLEDGTFFRKNLMHEFHEDTMWIDDLYMSVPFLCRYFQLTGERKYIDDAAAQFFGFKKRLYIPGLKMMAHVYDFQRDLATGIPWGRGNGWVLFSLSELLAVLPADHEKRPALLEFFRDLCEGYLAQQDAEGMWHQVLNEHDSYPETSCTSMFAYAFARGVQYGWLDEPEPYAASVFRAWDAINRISIDQYGNVYGVCRGSEFSFQSDYYKNDLSWNLNDTHGIGIVLLAGVEVLRLAKHLESESGGNGYGVPVATARRAGVAAVGGA